MSKRFLPILALSFLVVATVFGCHRQPPTEELPPPSPPSEDKPAPPSEELAAPPSEEPPKFVSKKPPPTPVTPPTLTELTMLFITNGEVYVMKAGTNTWVEAQVGTTVGPNDTLRAGDDSWAVITFFEGSTIELEAGAIVSVVELGMDVDSGSTTISLWQEVGKTISRVQKFVDPASRYEIETPAATMAVRGSIVHVTVAEDGTTTVAFEKGHGWVKAQGVIRRIPEGWQCTIIPGEPPGLIVPWGWPFDDNGDGDEDIEDTVGLPPPPAAPQLWYLDSETAPAGYEMEKSGGPGDDGQTGSVDIGAGNGLVWLADQTAVCDVTFPSGSWVVEIRTDSDWGTGGDKCEVSVGGWDTATGWYEIPTITVTTITWDDGQNILTILLQTGSATIYQDDYLALKLKNNDSGSHTIDTNGRSSLRSPDTDPGYPVPELAAGILLGLGLVGLAGYLGLRRRKGSEINV